MRRGPWPLMGPRKPRRTDYRDDQRAGSTHAVDGLPTSELCRKHGLSPATFYKLKAKYGGMDLSDANRLKQLEAENAKLKRLVADVMLDRAIVAPLVQAQWRGSC